MTRLSELLLPTERQPPADAEAISHKLMVRAGLVRQVGAGLWSWLPAGWRVHQKAAQIVREEMDGIGAQEMLMPLITPADLWKRSGRYDIDELFKLQDRKGRRSDPRPQPRGDAHLPRRRRRAVLPRPAEAAVPLPDQGPRRGPPARRRPAHARVHHEGRLLLRSRRGWPRRQLRQVRRRLRPGLRSLRPGVVLRRVRRRHDGRQRRSRVHGAVAPRENDVVLAPGYAANVEVASAEAQPAPPLPDSISGELDTPGASTIDALAAQLGIHPGMLLKAFPIVTEGRGPRDAVPAGRPPRAGDQADQRAGRAVPPGPGR